MELASGRTLSHYRIAGKIGEGGMGAVYRALDLRLEREVAVKVLPAGRLADESARTRFRQEALALSRLSHPHIAVVHDFDSEAGVDFLVMELLEGETLAARLEKGPLPLEQALRHAIQIADALDRAHRQGIVHRDLKPANVMLTPGGAKLLDFGLARLLGPETAAGGAGLSNLVTDARHLTAEGAIVGTFQHMAPEQLEGKPADARTDLFALGAVLYEMCTGRKAFESKSQAGLITAVMSAEPPPIAGLQPMAPPALDRLVMTCLAKQPDDRWQTAHDLSLQLRWIAEGGSQAGLPAPVSARRRTRERWAWAATAILAVLCAALAVERSMRAAPEARVVRSAVPPPNGKRFDIGKNPSGGFSVSPDGRYLTYSLKGADGEGDGDGSLWLRSLDSLAARLLPGTRGARWPFWSPDGRFIAFFAGGKLKKVDLAGSPAVTICDADDARNGSWSAEGVILFSPSSISPIHRVDAGGGQSTPVTTLDEESGETTHRWAAFLPGGRSFLYLAGTHSAGVRSEANALYAGELGSDRRTLILRARSNAVYAGGRLLYVRDRVLLAQPFDPDRLELTGDPAPVAESVAYDTGYFRAAFAASGTGVLAYFAGGAEPKVQLTWLDRSGKELGKVGEPGDYNDIVLSPDAKRAALTVASPDSGTVDIWVQDLSRGVRTRLTSGATDEDHPVWSPDGRRIAYVVTGKFDDLFVRATDGGREEPLLRSEQDKRPTGWSSDGRLLVFDAQDPSPKRQWDIWVLPLSGGEPRPFLQTEAQESGGKLSPDGRWMVYLSNESGRDEVYVAPFPDAGARWQVSVAGALQAYWTRGGREILYLTPGLAVMSVAVRGAGANFEVESPRSLFDAVATVSGDVTADGERALVAALPRLDVDVPLTLVLNWPEGLGR